MTPKEAKALLPIFQAYAEGKPVQYKDSVGEWRDSANLSFVDPPERYRLAPPKPLEAALWVRDSDGEIYSRFTASPVGTKMSGWTVKLFREVMK